MGPLEFFEKGNFEVCGACRNFGIGLLLYNQTWPLVTLPVLSDQNKFPHSTLRGSWFARIKISTLRQVHLKYLRLIINVIDILSRFYTEIKFLGPKMYSVHGLPSLGQIFWPWNRSRWVSKDLYFYSEYYSIMHNLDSFQKNF